jgi:phage terminase small subunit
MALTPKQEQFVLEYMIDLNATQAAIRAGYKKESAYAMGHENLNKPQIRARIEELREERAEKLSIDADWVLNRLMQVSERSLSVKPVLKWNTETRSMEESGEYQFDSNGANKALELIGKHLGMFKEKIEHSGDMTFVINRKKVMSDASGED